MTDYVDMRTDRDPIIRVIGVLKLLKAAALIAFGLAAMHLIGRDVGHELRRWISSLHLDPGNKLLATGIAKLSGANDRTLFEIGLAAMSYAGLFVIEGVGLLMRKVWAEYVTSIITTSFVPLESYEVAERASVVKLIVLVLNVAIVIYLVWRLYRQQRWPFHRKLLA